EEPHFGNLLAQREQRPVDLGVPKPGGAVSAGRYDAAVVSSERSVPHPVRMPLKNSEQIAVRGVPDPRRTILTGGDQKAAIGRKAHVIDVTRMRFMAFAEVIGNRLDFLSRSGFIQLWNVTTLASQTAAVRRHLRRLKHKTRAGSGIILDGGCQ